VGIYRTLYGPTIEPLLRKYAKENGSFHGSFLRDLFLEHVSKGRFIVDTQDEQLLKELVADGELEVLQRAPTTSQAAFSGLTYSKQGYESTKWPVNTLHWWYRWLPAQK
jgi:hypothetical protein